MSGEQPSNGNGIKESYSHLDLQFAVLGTKFETIVSGLKDLKNSVDSKLTEFAIEQKSHQVQIDNLKEKIDSDLKPEIQSFKEWKKEVTESWKWLARTVYGALILAAIGFIIALVK